MKKLLVLLLALVMVLSTFAACSKPDTDDDGNADSSKTEASETKKPGTGNTTKPNETPNDTPDGTDGEDIPGEEPEDETPGDIPEDETPADETPGDVPEDETPGNDPEGTTPNTTPDTTPVTPPSTTPIIPAGPIGNLDSNINLNEKEYIFLSRGHASYADEVCVDSSAGDPIDDAVMKRKNDVERKLKCKIKNVKVNETATGTSENGDYAVITELKKTMGPDCSYDIIAASAYTAFENTATGMCTNLKDVAHIDLSQDYWAPYFNENASIGNAQYFATGSISLSLRRMIFVTFFNKELAEDRDIENLYDVVNEGRWTLDYQAEILANTWSEEDGENGKTEGDFYGLVTNSHICVDPYWTACDVKILVKNNENFFEIQPETGKLDSILNKLKDIYKDSQTYAFIGESGDKDQDKIRKKFTDEEAIMATLRLIEVEAEDFRNMDAEYGIIPIPKFDEAQKNYYSHAHDQFIVYGIVNKANANFDNVGAVLECMAIESERTVKNAYFEIALKGKYSKDQQSWDMLDMIVRNLKIDGGMLYTIKLNDITQQLRNTVKAKAATVSVTVFHAIKVKSLNIKLEAMQTEIKTIQ